MSSSYRNRIPKRKYRQRAQPSNRQKYGLLEKKKDYKQRAKNYHQKQDQMNKYKLKANLKNQDQFYFQMIKGKRGQDGKHITIDSDESDFDQKQFKSALKTQNYSIVQMRRSTIHKKINRIKSQLHLLAQSIPNKQHKIFVQSQEQLNNFNTAKYFKSEPQLIKHNLLDINVEQLNKCTEQYEMNSNLKQKYNRLAQYIEQEEKLSKILMKISYEKNLLGSERKMIKKNKAGKIHKYFMERKK